MTKSCRCRLCHLTGVLPADMIAGVGKVMKTRVVRISLAILVVVGILLGLLVVLMLDTGPETSFAFLDGCSLYV